MLVRVKDILVSGGSLLVVSEIHDDHTATYLVNYDEQNPRRLRSRDYGSFDELKAAVKKLPAASKEKIFITSIGYLSTPDDMRLYAERFGLRCTILREFDETDLLAQENRWVKRDGFVVKLTKI